MKLSFIEEIFLCKLGTVGRKACGKLNGEIPRL